MQTFLVTTPTQTVRVEGSLYSLRDLAAKHPEYKIECVLSCKQQQRAIALQCVGIFRIY